MLAVVEGIRRSLQRTRYQHTTFVREREGHYFWDCSGMAAWILRRAAPSAFAHLGRARPVARDFAQTIERAPRHRPASGWQRIEPLAEARPGDLFAWRRPRGFPSRNTGHVGFLLDRPRPVPGLPGGFAVRVADATSFGHQDDARNEASEGGFGIGTLVFLTDETGRGTSYGWRGTESEAYVVTPILIGRVSR